MSLNNLPDESRVWVYGFSKKLNSKERKLVESRLEEFVASWSVHGSRVEGGFEIIENQFVLLATNNTVSGCSIDSSVSVFKELKQIHGLDALNQNLIYFKNKNDEIEAVLRADFQKLVNKEKVSHDTIVYNLLVSNIKQVKENNFITSFFNSWHSKVFKIAREVIS